MMQLAEGHKYLTFLLILCVNTNLVLCDWMEGVRQNVLSPPPQDEDGPDIPG